MATPKYISYSYCLPASPIPYPPKDISVSTPIPKGSSFPTINNLFGDNEGFIPSTSETAVNRVSLQAKEWSFSDAEATKDTAIAYVDGADSVLEAVVAGEYQLVYQYTTDNAAQLFSYLITIVTNYPPLPRWTAKGVIERLLLRAETLKVGEQPRFHLNAEQAEQFDKIEMPEMHFTNCTLREALQTVGSYIHGEPRLRGNEIIYDMYGGNEKTGVKFGRYASKTYSQTIEGAITAVDSTVDNLVSTLGYAKGVTVEPYAGGYKTVRTETLYARIQDDNMLIQVSNGINRIIKLEASYVGKFTDIDITSYVFEESEYSRMSAYTELYPTSRVFALYYSTGGTTIQGLNYKITQASGSPYGDFAILRILKAETGDNSLNLEPYPLLAFRVTYESITSARVKQSKQYTLSPVPTEIAYNQGQNLIESGYFGENLKGVAARLGNVDKVITIIQRGKPNIPKAGMLYDDEYYISAVAAEIMPYHTKITCALSKDWNRYSDYISVDSQRRFYEVSEKQAYDSFINFRDYAVIGDAIEIKSSASCHIGDIIKSFNPTDGETLTLVQSTSIAKDLTTIAQVVLPVKALPLGNSAVFSFKYKDNYSAGDQAVYQGSGNVTGYFQQGTQYKDYYGNIESLALAYCEGGIRPDDEDDRKNVELSLPGKYGSGRITLPQLKNQKMLLNLHVQIGATEIPNITYQIDYVTNRRDIVIGSGLARNLPLVAGAQSGNSAKLYVLPQRVNKLSQKVDLTGATLIYDYANGGISTQNQIARFNACTSAVSGEAWAIVDGDGNLLIAENKPVSGDGTTDILGGLRITLTHNIF